MYIFFNKGKTTLIKEYKKLDVLEIEEYISGEMSYNVYNYFNSIVKVKVDKGDNAVTVVDSINEKNILNEMKKRFIFLKDIDTRSHYINQVYVMLKNVVDDAFDIYIKDSERLYALSIMNYEENDFDFEIKSFIYNGEVVSAYKVQNLIDLVRIDIFFASMYTTVKYGICLKCKDMYQKQRGTGKYCSNSCAVAYNYEKNKNKEKSAYYKIYRKHYKYNVAKKNNIKKRIPEKEFKAYDNAFNEWLEYAKQLKDEEYEKYRYSKSEDGILDVCVGEEIDLPMSEEMFDNALSIKWKETSEKYKVTWSLRGL